MQDALAPPVRHRRHLARLGCRKSPGSAGLRGRPQNIPGVSRGDTPSSRLPHHRGRSPPRNLAPHVVAATHRRAGRRGAQHGLRPVDACLSAARAAARQLRVLRRLLPPAPDVGLADRGSHARLLVLSFEPIGAGADD